jgi:uncharacterized membrane protein
MAGLLVTFAQAYISYDKGIQTSSYYYPVGLSLNVIGGIFWYFIAKNTPEKTTLFASLIWDIFLVMSFMLVPILLFGVTITKYQMIGIGLIVIGILFLKF